MFLDETYKGVPPNIIVSRKVDKQILKLWNWRYIEIICWTYSKILLATGQIVEVYPNNGIVSSLKVKTKKSDFISVFV